MKEHTVKKKRSISSIDGETQGSRPIKRTKGNPRGRSFSTPRLSRLEDERQQSKTVQGKEPFTAREGGSSSVGGHANISSSPKTLSRRTSQSSKDMEGFMLGKEIKDRSLYERLVRRHVSNPRPLPNMKAEWNESGPEYEYENCSKPQVVANVEVINGKERVDSEEEYISDSENDCNLSDFFPRSGSTADEIECSEDEVNAADTSSSAGDGRRRHPLQQ